MRAIVAIGSNCHLDGQDFENIVEKSISRLSADFASDCAASRFYAAPAFPKGSGPDYVNAVVTLEARHTPDQVLESLHRIEDEFSRLRPHRWAPRTLDLDLIDFGGQVLPDSAVWAHWAELPFERQQQDAPNRLILPHPRVQDRAFVLKPLLDVAPDWVHPVLGMNVAQMLARLPAELCEEVAPLT